MIGLWGMVALIACTAIICGTLIKIFGNNCDCKCKCGCEKECKNK